MSVERTVNANSRAELCEVVAQLVAAHNTSTDPWADYAEARVLIGEAAQSPREYERAIRAYCQGVGL